MTEFFEVKSLEEMPKALNFLIKKVDNLQETVHPKKQTVYEWVSKKTIPYHKMTKGLMFLQSEIDEWLKRGAQKSEEELLQEAKAFVLSKKGKEV